MLDGLFVVCLLAGLFVCLLDLYQRQKRKTKLRPSLKERSLEGKRQKKCWILGLKEGRNGEERNKCCEDMWTGYSASH